MIWQRESEKAFPEIRDFYWRLIDDMASVNDRIGWKKGIYPSDDFLIESLKKGELYSLRENGVILGTVILNSDSNEGYKGLPWPEILLPTIFWSPTGWRSARECRTGALAGGWWGMCWTKPGQKVKRLFGWIFWEPIGRRKLYTGQRAFPLWRPERCTIPIRDGRSIKCLS